jgi:molybdopterin-binding protein
MNALRGRIAAIQSEGHLSLVDVAVEGQLFTAILLETPQSAPYLAAGVEVSLLFKETEVSLAKNLSGLLSLRNRFQATVSSIVQGVIMSEVRLDYHGHRLSSIITTRAVERLGLAVGDAVEALVKANEMSLMEVVDDV